MRTFFLLFVLLVSGCARFDGGTRPLELRDAEILSDTVWEGTVLIDGSVRVAKGAKLTLRPGTDVRFLRKDLDRDGLGDGTLVVEGTLHAVGTRSRPIRFRSAAADPSAGDWLEIRADHSRDLRLRFCEISDSSYTLHAHFTRGVIEDCIIRNNIEGCRLGQSRFTIRNCLIEKNRGKGINFRNSAVEVTRNIIRDNGAGIFLFESDRESSIHHNNLHGNIYNFRLGDFFTGTVQLSDNWWGTGDPAAAAATIYDRKLDPAIGRVEIEPSADWVPGTGPRDELRLDEAWRFPTGAYVDASPVMDAGRIYVPGWDGRLYALDRQGRTVWTRPLGDIADSAVAIDGDTVYCQTWSRELHALDRTSGDLRWRFTFAPSPADDHRQGAPIVIGDLLLLPTWNGALHALDADSGISRWCFRAPLPLRAAPAADGDRIYLASGAGTLAALTLGGDRLWELDLGAPLLSSPAVTPQGPVAVSREGTLFGLDREGNVRWRRELEEVCYYGGALFAGEAVYLGTAAGALWKLDAATGRVLWRRATSAPVYATPQLADGRLFVADNGGTLHAFGAESGDLLATFQVPREIQGTPALDGSRLFFGSRDHHVYAVDLIEGVPEAEAAR